MAEAKSSGRRRTDVPGTIKLPLREGSLSSWTVLTTLLFCVTGLIAGGLLYYSYVQNREVSLSKQHFRNLGTIGTNLSKETKAFEKIIEAAGVTLQVSELKSKFTPLPRDQRCFSEPFIRVTGAKDEKHGKAIVEKFGKDKPFFTFLCSNPKLSEVFIALDITPAVDVSLDLFQRQKSIEPLTLALEEGYEFRSLKNDDLSLVPTPVDNERDTRYFVTPEINGQRGLRLEKGLPKPRIPTCAKCMKNMEYADYRLTLHARFELQPILDELVQPETFADVLVTDESGNVIVHRQDKERSADTRLERLDQLLRQELEPGRGATIQNVPADMRKLSLWEQLPLQKTVRLGESEYYLYALAVPIDSWRHGRKKLEGDAGRLKLIVAGLVPVSEVMWQALAIPHGVSLALIFVSFALTFTLPLIKLATMGPRDRLGLPDALGCMFFTMMGAALLTFTIGAWGLHNNVRSTADARLLDAAAAVQQKFSEELRVLVLKLEERSKGKIDSDAPKQCVSFNMEERQHRACFNMPFKGSAAPLIHTTIWVDPLGEIVNLETIRSTSILTRNIGSRPYIQSAWVGDLLRLRQGKEGPEIKGDEKKPFFGFTINPVYIWDDGEFATMITAPVEALPANVPREKNTQGAPKYDVTDYVVAIRARMEKLVGTVVPVGYGYAVIDDTGEVLYDSEKTKNLRENLFAETDYDVQLTSLVSAKTKRTLRVNYHGRAHVMHVTKLLEPLKWTLIVYRDTRWLDWVTDQALFSGVALFTGYSFVILVGGLFVLIIFQSVRSGDGGWMWPAEGRANTYYGLALLNVTVMLVVVGIAWIWAETHPGRVPLVAVVLAAVTMGLTVICLQQTKATQPRNKQGIVTVETKWAYSILATTAILLMAAMPAGVLLSVGFQRALSLYETYEAWTFAMNVKTYAHEKELWYQRILPPSSFTNMNSLQGPAHYRECCTCFEASNPKQPIHYWEFLSDRPIDTGCDPLGQKTFPQSLDERLRGLLHLWMWEPGEQLGGWIGSREMKTAAPPSMFFTSNAHTPILITLGLLGGIGTILWYMRLCEDPRLKRRRIVVAGLAVLLGFLYLLYLIENKNSGSSIGTAFNLALYMGLGSMLVTAATYGSQRMVCHYLFLMDFAEPLRKASSKASPGRRVLIVIPPMLGNWIQERMNRERWLPVEIPSFLRDHEREGILQDARIDKERTPLALLWFDHRLSEPPQAKVMLKVMERLSLQSDRPILVVAHRHPFDPQIVSFESSDIPVQDRSSMFSRDRWAEAFKDFLVIPFSGFKEPDDQVEMVERLLKDPDLLLDTDPWPSSWVSWVEERTNDVEVRHPALAGTESKLRYALGMLRCRYEYWWADCTPSEKLALWHVATERFLHASNSKLYPLLWKGLLKLDPDLRLRSQSWQLFVTQAGDRDQLGFLKPDLKPSTWAKISRPLLLGLLSAVVFLSVTQENVREVIIALVPVLPAFLIEIPRLLSGGLRSAITRES